MIALPSATVNAGDAAAIATLDRPLVDPALEATVARVRDWGGDPRRYRVALSRGLDALGVDGDHARYPDRDPTVVRSLAAVAGWRAGVLDLRDDALARIADLPVIAAASTLGLAPAELEWFLTAQYTDRFAWPGQKAGDVIARVGGFRGLGGSWVDGPTDATVLGDGRFRVSCGGETWMIRADVFGASLSRGDTEQATGHAAKRGAAKRGAATGHGVDAVVSPWSYLVDLVRRT